MRRAAVVDVGETVLAVVCDGMGGLKKGEVASATVIDAFGKWFDAHLQMFPALCGTDFSQVRLQWTTIINELHLALLSYSAENRVQLGTTVSAFFAYADRYLTLTVGDSRIYEKKTSGLRQLTQDQSLVAREVALGRITEEQSRHHPQRNVLLQCIGVGDHIAPAFTEGRIGGDTLYLICTDGFAHELLCSDMEQRLNTVYLSSKNDMTAVLCEMTELCKARGETDNITAVLLKSAESGRRKRKRIDLKRLWRKILHPQKVPYAQKATLLETAQIIHTSETISHN